MDAALLHTLERVRAAAADRTLLRITGGGSKDFYAPLAPNAQRLDTQPLQGVVSYEPSELVVTVRAGTPLAHLEAVLAAQGQCLAFEPPHFAAAGGAVATVGGMVAAGWSGPARASVGAVRDFVLGAELINGRGELLRFGGTVMKNVAGYDVSRLMAGSWGTLGVLTEVSLKVLPCPPSEATLRLDGLTQAQALQRLHGWGAQPLPLNASTWLQQEGQGVLYVRLRGAAAAVHTACRSMGGTVLPVAEGAAFWAACREQTLPWFAQRTAVQALWRLSLPQTAHALALPAGMQTLVEWHGAQRWVLAQTEHAALLQQLARAAGGYARVWRPSVQSATCVAATAAQPAPSPALQRIQAQLQQAFDPVGIFGCMPAAAHG